MDKLSLDLDDLKVDSFKAVPGEKGREGTVFGEGDPSAAELGTCALKPCDTQFTCPPAECERGTGDNAGCIPNPEPEPPPGGGGGGGDETVACDTANCTGGSPPYMTPCEKPA